MSIYIPASYQEEGGAKVLADRLIDGGEAIAAEAPEVFGIAHSEDNLIGDSSYVVAEERYWQGLSPFGSGVVAEMNRLGIMIDISHVSDLTFDQVLDLSTAPVIASHRPQRRVPVPQSDPGTARGRVQ